MIGGGTEFTMETARRITFVLSGSGNHPVGGLRIVYEYANRLAARGWKVTVIHPARLDPLPPGTSLIRRLRFRISVLKGRFRGTHLPKQWFKISPQVSMRWIPALAGRFIPDADYIVACPAETAFFVSSCSSAKGRKFYFIQGFENWAMPIDKLIETWKLPLKKIVVSSWLLEKARKFGETAFLIPNAFDFAGFRVDIPFSERPARGILFIYHFLELKGSGYAIEAAATLKIHFPDLIVEAFGLDDPPAGLPEFISYKRNPPQSAIREYYNRSRIFIAPSLSEGWGLPAGEAILCGCAVVATNIGGHREFLRDNENGLFCLPGSAASIVEKVEWLFNNPREAERIAAAAPRSLDRFNWDSSVALFEQTLLQ